MKKLSFFNKIIYGINTFFSIGLLLSFFFAKIPPNQSTLASIASLIVPILIIGNIFFVLYWILAGFKKQMVQPFLVLLLSYFFLPTLYKIKGSDQEPGKNSIKIMSYNVRKFNLYKWLGDKETGTKISTFIKEEDPDIVALQEYKEIKEFKLNYPYSYNHVGYDYNKKISHPSGLIIYSKYPIINSGPVDSTEVFTSIIFADIVKQKDTFRVFNFHLESLGLNLEKEYFGHKDSEKLLTRLGTSFKVQQKEIDTFNNFKTQLNYRSILLGDMNNTAYSWAYKSLRSDLKDTFLEAGQGFGKTYEFKRFPLRIDYIFTDPAIKVVNHQTYKNHYSDHYPIQAILEF